MTPLLAAKRKMLEVALVYADALVSEDPKAGWNELQAMEQAALELRKAVRANKRRP